MNDSLPYKEELSESDLRNSNTPYIKRKILVLGGQNVGKTALIKRFKSNVFIEEYDPTIQITTKKIITLNKDYIDLEIVDLEGQNEYTIFAPNKFAFGYNAYMLIYDVKDKKSFELIKHIYEQINNLSGKTAKILIGTKSDSDIDSGVISRRQVSIKESKKYANKIHCPFIEISSKDNKNIEEAFRLLLIEINKTESGINLKKLKFFRVFEFFIHHEKLTIYSYYLNLFILAGFSFVFIYLGISTELNNEDENYYFGIGFPFIILGLWGLLFNVCGIYGMITKSTNLLELNHNGLIIDGIYIGVTLIQVFAINIVQSKSKNIFNNLLNHILFMLANTLPLILTVILSKIFKIIYQQDLQSYMA